MPELKGIAIFVITAVWCFFTVFFTLCSIDDIVTRDEDKMKHGMVVVPFFWTVLLMIIIYT